MAEANLLSYFPSSTKAERAREELKRNGFQELQVDRVRRFGGNESEDNQNAMYNSTPSLSMTLLDSEIDPRLDAGVISGADTASSMSADEHFQAGGEFLLVAVVPEEEREIAQNIIKEYGGKI